MSSRIRRLGRPSWVLLLAMLATFGASAAGAEHYRIEIVQIDLSRYPDVDLVAQVVDSAGKPVKGLRAEDLHILEQDRPQAADVVLASTVAPVALVLALDTSGSMAGRPLEDAKAALRSTVASLGPADRAALVTFDTTSRVAHPLTAEKAALLAAIDRASAAGNTAIFDAAAAALDVLATAPEGSRRAVVLVTDGVDNSSALGRDAVLARIGSSGVPVHVVGLGSDLDRSTLQALADASRGGQASVAPTSAQLRAIYEALAEQLLTQYAIHYRAEPRGASDEQRAITIRIVRDGELLASTLIRASVAASGVPHLPSTDRSVIEVPRAPATVPDTSVARAPQAVVLIAAPLARPEAIAVLGAASAAALVLAALSLQAERSFAARLRRRMRDLTPGPATATDRHTPSFTRLVPLLLGALARPVRRFMPSAAVEGQRARLAMAGDPFDLGPLEFIGIRLAVGVLGALLAIPATLVLVGGDASTIAIGVILGFVSGTLLPGIFLSRAIAARRRRIVRSLPAVLDLIALSASAGLTFDGAVAQVTQRWNDPLADELRRLLMDFRVGRDRRGALRALAQRTGVREIDRLAAAVIQADARGVPVSQVLADQAASIRTRRRQRSAELARIAPVKMLFPMVLLIFPALFVVILGPAVPRLLTIFRY